MTAFTLRNASGMEARFIGYGGTIVSLRVPDRFGKLADVTPGYDTADEYAHDTRYFGSLIGRFANRIANGRFTLDGIEYDLSVNEGRNQLHGGPCGFDKVEWRVAPFQRPGAMGAVLCHRSPAGDQGYPGTLHARVTYTLSDDNALSIDYSAITDAPTIVNLTQHMYFNLAGHDAGDILDHELMIAASRYTPMDAMLIPTGEIRDVRGSPFDFTTPRSIGAHIGDDDEQIRIGGGYDHNFVLDRSESDAGNPPTLAARVVEPRSGRVLEVLTTEPGLQLYSGSGTVNGPSGKGGHSYVRNAAFALETQHFPDSPNHPHFPSTVVRPGHEYQSRTVYRFSVV
jgi:aldose 1-epimerase